MAADVPQARSRETRAGSARRPTSRPSRLKSSSSAAPRACAPHPAHRSSRARGRKRGHRQALAAFQAAARSPSAGRAAAAASSSSAGSAGGGGGAMARSPSRAASTIHARRGSASTRRGRGRLHPVPGPPGAASRPRLPEAPGGHRPGSPGLPRSFHFKSTLRKFAKLVSRWLLRVPGGRRASTCGGGGSGWFQVAPARARQGGVGSGAGPRRDPRLRSRSGTGRTARRDPSGRLLPGRCARPARPRSRPGPARPRPARRVLFGPGGSRPGGARREDRYGDAGAQRRRGLRAGPSPAASPPGLPLGAGPKEDPGRERQAERRGAGWGRGSWCRGHQCGGGSTLRGLSATEAPTRPRQR